NKFSIRIPEANPRRENPLQIKSLELTALITEGDFGPNEDKEDTPSSSPPTDKTTSSGEFRGHIPDLLNF
ncbi:MAG: hypothetical protein MUP68_16800, partial [Deltaproteobacteria bacterium]|nr:hypothetical protein [Deltaproteobacteria bacterium]